MPPAAAPQRPTVLVIEPDIHLGDIVAEFLEHSGLAVRRAGSGAEALAPHRDAPAPDAVVVAWSMQGVSGQQLLNRLHDRWPGAIFVVIAGQEPPRLRAAARHRCWDAVVHKPFSMRVLARAVHGQLAAARDRAADRDRARIARRSSVTRKTHKLLATAT